MSLRTRLLVVLVTTIFLLSAQPSASRISPLMAPGVSDDGGKVNAPAACVTATVYVDDDWVAITPGTDPDGGGPATDFGCDSFATIQEGVSAVDNLGTVIVAAGTYPEGNNVVSINKSLTVSGPNSAIGPNGLTTRNPEAVITSQGTSISPNSVFVVAGANHMVTVQGFQFDATPSPMNAYSANDIITLQKNIFTATHDPGMYFETPNLTIHDNRFVDIVTQTEDTFAVGRNVGVVRGVVSITDNVWSNISAPGANLDTVSGTISGNSFQNVTYYGFLLAFDCGDLAITGNTFDGITNPDQAGVPTWGSGVRFYAPAVTSPVNITGNTFSSSFVGVGIRGVPNDAAADISGMPIHVNLNRFIDNNSGISNGAAGSLDAENNWWGCNAGPGNTGCDSVIGTVDFDPWLVLGISASPNPIVAEDSTTATADMTHNSDGTDTSASGTVPLTPVAFSATNGSMPPTGGTITAGQASSTFTSNSSLNGTACATVDHQIICTVVIVASPVTVSLPHVTGPTGSGISVRMTVGDLTGKGVKSYTFHTTFDPTMVQPQAVPYDTTFTLSSGMVVTFDTTNAGHLIISASQATDLTGSGTLIKLLFNIVGLPGTVSPLNFQGNTDAQTVFPPGFTFNTGAPEAITSNGSIHINGPTAADGRVSGRILDATGAPIEGAAIRLSGTQNRLTVTDREGNYHFENVETSGFYTVSPTRPNFIFNPSGRSFSQLGANTEAGFTATETAGGLNPLDETVYFVRQQYLDFLGREPDEAGLGFWVNNINMCGSIDECLSAKRIDTSAAFFLSIEFQQTGYLVHRVYQSAYGDMPGAPVPLTHAEFNADKDVVGEGVVVNQAGWETMLEANKEAFAAQVVERVRFISVYPAAMSPAEFVDRLFMNAGVTPDDGQRAEAVGEFAQATDSSNTNARARALRRVADNAKLREQQFSEAFVLLQYFGYLGRDPNAGADTDFAGYSFWLDKLHSFGGDYRNAEMVKAFISAGEYRGRFPR